MPFICGIFYVSGNDEDSNEYRIGGCFVFVTKTLIMQGNRIMPSRTSNRIAFASILLGGITMYYLWEAMLISYLAVRKVSLPLRTLNDLSKKSEYKVKSNLNYCLCHHNMNTHL